MYGNREKSKIILINYVYYCISNFLIQRNFFYFIYISESMNAIDFNFLLSHSLVLYIFYFDHFTITCILSEKKSLETQIYTELKLHI